MLLEPLVIVAVSLPNKISNYKIVTNACDVQTFFIIHPLTHVTMLMVVMLFNIGGILLYLFVVYTFSS